MGVLSRKSKRTQSDYKASARKIRSIAPGLKNIDLRKPLKPWQKAWISRLEKKLRYADNLFKLTPKQAKKFKGQLVGPGIHAVQLKNVGRDTKVQVVKDNLIVTTNGRTWLYWKLDREEVRSRSKMTRAAERAFDMQFPLEKISELARVAFEELHPLRVSLWTAQGRVGKTYTSLKQFMLYLRDAYSGKGSFHEADPEKWVFGLAIQIAENDHDERGGAAEEDDESEEDSEL